VYDDSIRTESVVQVTKLMAGSAISAPMSGGQNRRSSAVSVAVVRTGDSRRYGRLRDTKYLVKRGLALR
jgi:hypothetical protein